MRLFNTCTISFVRLLLRLKNGWWLSASSRKPGRCAQIFVKDSFFLPIPWVSLAYVVNNINTPKSPGATEAVGLVDNRDSIASEGKGEYMDVHERILDTKGNPIPNAIIDTWEIDENGLDDTQYAEQDTPDCRGKLESDVEGNYFFRAVVRDAFFGVRTSLIMDLKRIDDPELSASRREFPDTNKIH
ncbi:hypothetical protein D9758_009670 [Tetrapyrgos nigripes]|uniref:Intradiol ring-cleavage dioxygenases domain-containing protein n=1 Tax=Tetrapyrgos nigripes TaxID=182062 RepID=A0A8H5CNP8_9AGAR|nr:hypothetical protein D9758_009670 [Tetrapyrgos nigripes]